MIRKLHDKRWSVSLLVATLIFGVIPITASAAGRTATTVINTLLNGKGVPAASLGINGDFYIDKTAMNLYGPKALGKWPLPVSMRGAVGPMGPVGVDGKVGEKGTSSTSLAGAVGSKGETGATGATGATGSPGAPGASGAGGAGPIGATGATGSAGTTGATGSGGTAGTTGATGATGSAGTSGANGSAGFSGTNGTNGIPGANGEKGAQGNTGATGGIGNTGEAGAAGAQGNQGNQGAQGSQGVIGEPGIAGPPGAIGPSEVTWGNITFSTLMLVAPVYGTSSPIGSFLSGNSYMVDLFIYGESTQGNDRSLQITFSTGPTTQIIHSQYLVINGSSVRVSMDTIKTESSILVKILINGRETTSDFSITATVGSGSDTADDAVTLRGNFTSQLVGRAVTN
jgi:Collagen triple helix repeat (20 copies)